MNREWHYDQRSPGEVFVTKIAPSPPFPLAKKIRHAYTLRSWKHRNGRKLSVDKHNGKS